MREFIYFSKDARTSGNFDLHNLKDAGRMDIVCHTIIMSFFVSKAIRGDVKLHLVFYGQPDPPKHIVLEINEKNKEFFSKKDIAGLLKKMLYKYKKGQKIEVLPDCFIEKKNFTEIIEELKKQGKEICLLDKNGISIRDSKLDSNCVFVLGDQDGLAKQELKILEKDVKKISLGKVMYFASQSLAILQNELDLRGL